MGGMFSAVIRAFFRFEAACGETECAAGTCKYPQEKPPAVSRRGSNLKPFSSLWDEPDQKLR